LKAFGMEKTLHLQPVSSIHTTSGYNHDEHSVNSSFLYLLLLIGGLIQIIACINFMNLSTAQASKRAKEVGVRKVIGAGRKDLVRQFLGESFLVSLISVGLALPLLVLALPFLNGISQVHIGLSFLSDYRLWLVLATLVLLTGLVAGSYPAFYLSRFKPVKVLKGVFKAGRYASLPRQILVVLQFTVSLTLIIGTIFVYRQVLFLFGIVFNMKFGGSGFLQNSYVITIIWI